jgi:hypothetical protein
VEACTSCNRDVPCFPRTLRGAHLLKAPSDRPLRPRLTALFWSPHPCGLETTPCAPRSDRAGRLRDLPCAVLAYELHPAAARSVVARLVGRAARRADFRPRRRTPLLCREAVPRGRLPRKASEAPRANALALRVRARKCVLRAILPIRHGRVRAGAVGLGRTHRSGRLIDPRIRLACECRVATRIRVRPVFARERALAWRPCERRRERANGIRGAVTPAFGAAVGSAIRPGQHVTATSNQ